LGLISEGFTAFFIRTLISLLVNNFGKWIIHYF